MDMEHQQLVTQLAGQAFDMDPIQRDSWLKERCAGNAQLYTDVAALLGVMASGGNFTGLDSLHGDVAFEGIDETQWLGQTIGPYRVLEKLGEGGMGWVFLAEQTEPIERKVAIKIIKPLKNSGLKIAKLETLFPPLMDLTIRKTSSTSSDNDHSHQSNAVTERVQAEPQVLAMFTHPYIAQLFEAGKTPEGCVYFAMEYVPGEPLTHYCSSTGLGLQERLYLFMKVCRGVQHAHHNAVLHLDLKPSNILVRDIDGTASPKVIDFGIAMTTDPHGDSRLKRNLAMGTPVYMSPEALSGEEVNLDVRADVYSLGVILFELLTGKPAAIPNREHSQSNADKDAASAGMNGRAWKRKKARIWEKSDLSPRHFSPNLPRELDWIVLKATTVNREDRYESPIHLSADLKRFFSNQPVAAAPTSPLYVVRKFVARQKLVSAGFSLFLVIMIAGLGFLWNSQRRSKESLLLLKNHAHLMTALIDHTDWQPDNLNLDSFLQKAEVMVDERLPEQNSLRDYYLMLIADVYVRTGRLKQAEPLINESIWIVENSSEYRPVLVPKLFVRGRMFFADGRYDAAEKDFKRALAILERRKNIRRRDHGYYYLAKVYDAQARHGDTEAVVRRYFEKTKGQLRGRYIRELLGFLVKSLQEQGRHDEAEAFRKSMRELPPSNHLDPPKRRPPGKKPQ